MNDTDWTIIETRFDPHRLHQQETVFTLGNGYLGTRGSFEEGYPGAWPATFIHGVYDDVPIVYTELANCPDWTSLVILVEGERFRLHHGQVLSYERRLDLRHGLLSRQVRWRSPAGRTMNLCFERFASLADPHLLVLRCQITPLDFDGQIEVHTALNPYAENQGILHWQLVGQGSDPDRIWLHLRTRHSGIELGMAATLSIQGCRESQRWPMNCGDLPAIGLRFQAERGQTTALTKVVSVYTSHDMELMSWSEGETLVADKHASPELLIAPDNGGNVSAMAKASPCAVVDKAQSKLDQFASLEYETLREAHQKAWAEIWRDCDVIIEGDSEAQLAVRYNLFQILIAAPRYDHRVSIPAKTLSGFGYRGHVFWDTDIFIVPFLTFTQPGLARNLLSYRYHTLPGARRKAQAAGCEGTMYAWESADTGDEVTPSWVPVSRDEGILRIWCGDIELHISTDVAYAVWNYWQATGDDDWMRRYGAEIFLDTAVFWGSRVEWNDKRGCYEIGDVIGPDEYHEHVDNNAFTNQMVRWHLETALEVLAWLRRTDPEGAAELERRLHLTPERLRHWADVIECLFVPYDPETGLIEQFEGFFALEDINLADYEPRTRSMQEILGIGETNRRQVLKQPDVLMLLYLLRDRYDRRTLQVNWDYYVPRTDHTYGSSLGPCVHAILACELDKLDKAYEHFMRAALVDLKDVRGNAADGIHAASAGGLWQVIVFGFGGVRLTDEGPVAAPRLPAHWTRLKFRLQYRGRWYDFDFKRQEAKGREQEAALDMLPHSSTPEIKGVIFDLDGVLTDTSEFHYLGWQRLADEEGLPFDRQANEALRGISRRESLLRILGDRPATEEQIQEMMARKNRYYQEFIEKVTADNLLPGALELLQELRAAGIKVAIGSASKNARKVIGKLGIGNLVDVISDGYSVEKPKPAPDLFLHAAEQLGLPPEQCVVVEDAASGIEAALAAGMWAVGVGPADRVGAAHVILPSLAGLHWTDLKTRLAQAVQEAGAQQKIPSSTSRKEVMPIE